MENQEERKAATQVAICHIFLKYVKSFIMQEVSPFPTDV